jgi:hypothetical protein
MRWLLVALIVVVACGGVNYPDPLKDKLDKENRITVLWTQIREFRRDANMPLDPARTFVFQFQNRSVHEAARVCTAGQQVPPRCDDVCSISDNICDNAEAICGIADELGKDDEYAQDKCASAKASCREAKQRCCNCSASPPPEGT